jgi:enoyl-CoA hydratase
MLKVRRLSQTSCSRISRSFCSGSTAVVDKGPCAERIGNITVISINRPSRLNAVDAVTAALLRQLFEDFDRDANSSVAVLHGGSHNFCSGFDLKFLANSDRNQIVESIKTLHDSEGPGPMGPTRMLLGKPVIAAIEGYAVAGGLELALWCDIRIAAASAKFGVFCRRFGVPLIDGGTVRLPRVVGQGRAMDMVLTGREVDAQEALAMGLVTRVVPDGEALREALVYAERIAKFPQECMRADRLSVLRQWDFPLEEALVHEGKGGEKPLLEEAVVGALRFSGGARS